VVLPELESRTSFRDFVSAIFESGKRFVDLDYACLHHLLYVGVRYLGIEVDDALEIAEGVEV
jgi:hypothetical protein